MKSGWQCGDLKPTFLIPLAEAFALDQMQEQVLTDLAA